MTVVAQKNSDNCFEYMHSEENEYFDDTTLITNGSKLYYQWNCDSTWMTFENNDKIILKSCTKFDPILCSRLGLNFIKEYPKYLLFKYDWISGCCTSPDIVFIDKNNGMEINRITSDRFVWGDAEEDYILYFSDTTNFNKLIYLDNNTDKEYALIFENDKVIKSKNENHILQLSDIFKNFQKNESDFNFEFITNNGKTEKLKIKIN